MATVRDGAEHDLAALTAIYNHYVLKTPITFDVTPFTPEQRREWFDAHATTGRHRLIVAEEHGEVIGYATTSRWRPKPAYDTTVESTVYCRHDTAGRGIGTLLYRSLFERLATEDVHRIVAGVALPNDASVRLQSAPVSPGSVFSWRRPCSIFLDVAWFERPVTRPRSRVIRARSVTAAPRSAPLASPHPVVRASSAARGPCTLGPHSVSALLSRSSLAVGRAAPTLLSGPAVGNAQVMTVLGLHAEDPVVSTTARANGRWWRRRRSTRSRPQRSTSDAVRRSDVGQRAGLIRGIIG